jgi:hypothetical protein
MDGKLRRARAEAVAEQIRRARSDVTKLTILERFFDELRAEGRHPDPGEWLRIIKAALQDQ